MGNMLVHAIRDEALGNSSYLVEVGHGLAVAVDPRRDADDHLALARDRGLTIAAVLETHLHADFVSGAQEIAASTGAQIVAAVDARLRFPHRALDAGGSLTVGRATVEVIPTPGHTPEHVSYLISMGEGSALFSGGSLIVGGAARTDLTGPDRTDELARAQFASLRRVAGLPDDTELYPTHGGGSFCSTGRARSASSTVGAERATNPLLAIPDEDGFVEALLDGLGSYPRYFSHLRDVNRAGAPPLHTFDAIAELDGAHAQSEAERGAWLIDGRSVDRWAAAHPEGSISIEVRPDFATWLGWVVPFGQPVVFVLEADQVPEATRLARRIGYDDIRGWVRFGTWQAAGLPVASVEAIGPADAVARDGAVLLDVRQRSEYERGHIAGAAHMELGDIIAGKRPDADRVITYCGHGERSATAASLLARQGMHVVNLAGGSGAWREAGLPFDRER